MQAPKTGVIDRRAAKRGFTLIELSIVLVIIGLIAGSVLVGRNLIRSAEIRAQIGQIEKYNTAVNTFKAKYGGIPGDLNYGLAQQFGFYTFGAGCNSGAGAGSQGCGDGNGLLELQPPLNAYGLGEQLAFWRHLTDAGLIDGSYGVSGNSALTDAGGVTADVTDVIQSVPKAKLGNNFVIAFAGNIDNQGAVGNDAGYNYFQLLTLVGVSTAQYLVGGAAGMTPMDAYSIDTKIDDGMPNTGTVRNMLPAPEQWPGLWHTPGFSGFCITGGTDGKDVQATYILDPGQGSEEVGCSIRIRFN